MKRAIILHGTDGSPTKSAWQSWLQKCLEDDGYEVFFPQLPECHTPNVEKYDAFLKGSGWNFADNVIIGHSSGATTALHLLNKPNFPKAKAVILVETFLNERLLTIAEWHEPGQFDSLFVEDFDMQRIRDKANKFYFVHGDDDPYCDYHEAKQLCANLDGVFLTVPEGGHLGSNSNVAELPFLVDRLREDGLLQ